MKKILEVAIIGAGSRGIEAYGRAISQQSERFKITAVCDIRQVRLDTAKSQFGLQDKDLFLSSDEFFREKRGDILVVATQDQDHVWMGIKGMELGYHLLLEKPISPNKDDLYALLEASKKYDRKVIVCHVLRYAPAYVKIKEVLDSGILGKLVRIESLENVAWWHQAHSYVRGNWRREQDTSPMIMAKCCHDLDLLQWYANSKADTVYSNGSLFHFKKENAPKDATERCINCPHIHTCPYSAEHIYIWRWKNVAKCATTWPFDVVCTDRPVTEEGLRKAINEGPYGRCVFYCDNDVVDNQSVNVTFDNGICATLTMTAFTNYGGRNMVFHCTNGELEFREFENKIRISPFGKDSEIIEVSELLKNVKDVFGHGGGDSMLVNSIYNACIGNINPETSLEKSVESHLMAIAAEESRKTGNAVKVHK